MTDDKIDQSVFEKTCHYYLDQVFSKIHNLSADRLGVKIRNSNIEVDLLKCSYTISKDGILNQLKERPPFDVCVILLRYLLTDRENYPHDKNWCSYRDLKDSNPLLHYFKSNVEDAFTKEFTGNIDRLKESCESLGGMSLQEQFSQDISMQFNVLPRVPVLLLSACLVM